MAKNARADKPVQKSRSATAPKKNAKAVPAAAAPVKETGPRDISRSIFHQVFPYILLLAAVFVVICFLSQSLTGLVGTAIRTVFYGLFAGASFALPLLLLVQALLWKRDAVERTLSHRAVYAFIVLICIAVIIHVTKGNTETLNIKTLWLEGSDLVGGGVIGGLLGGLLMRLVGFAGSLIITVSLLVLFGIFLCGLTPKVIGRYIAAYFKESREKSKAERAERKRAEAEEKRYQAMLAKERAEEEPYLQGEPYEEEPYAEPQEQTGGFIDPEVFDDIYNDERKNPMKKDGHVDLGAIFEEGGEGPADDGLPEHIIQEATTEITVGLSGDGLSLMLDELPPDKPKTEKKKKLPVERKPAVQPEPAPEPEPVKPAYIFPPLSLLKKDPGTLKNQDVSEELRTNATKLVETLNSFKVRTKIMHVTRGPTITRYELAPEEGVRVRSIVNLVDDISLSLASTGVRIEAPIPGKRAVGIEVPNRLVSTVFLRELLENELFCNASSKVTVSLGVNVSNDAIFVDIAKMPHLLIAGATGMGKSVCINSMIVSLLYKATPDEVKLILIDPKKVELNIYNGLPHLLVPVVSDPKKAAGSLHWAVTEMERRFELIEEAGVREIMGYNAIAKDDPTMEKLPQVVIIIDELADLMMTAPDDVEDSICRLAQKARAAGMHLIIGTQRPSVDVITGLIKANIPSRIAFTVASQVDSRTIIDIAGAEKLIGRGDMLYAPVGAAKPGRVQGAFVSEQEVMKVCEFIKTQTGGGQYDDAVISSIEQAAARCGQGKKGAVLEDHEGGEDEDSMLKPAIELAVQEGKISTSLIQRKLSLGYGRAAKLIDEMEERGIVGPRNGQKPRDVLITKTQYMEMLVNQEDV